MYFLSVISVFVGMHKLHVYTNSEYTPETNVNAYVGGDAYNMIINSGHATAYFVLASGLAITATLFLILDKLNGNKESTIEEVQEQ